MRRAGILAVVERRRHSGSILQSTRGLQFSGKDSTRMTDVEPMPLLEAVREGWIQRQLNQDRGPPSAF